MNCVCAAQTECHTDSSVETLNINGAPSLSIPFPPFMEKQPPPPPPVLMPAGLYHKSVQAINEHPYLAGGMALAMTAGLGYGGYTAYTRTSSKPGRRLGSKGRVQDGMLKEAIGKPSCQNPADISAAGSLAKPANPGSAGGYTLESRLYRHCSCSSDQRSGGA
jgi:hypothetical protein